MNYDFLQNYSSPYAGQTAGNQYSTSSHATIEGAYGTYPVYPSHAAPDSSAYYVYGGRDSYNEGYSYNPDNMTSSTSGDAAYTSKNSFSSPSRHGTGYGSYRSSYKRKFNATGGASGGASARKKDAVIPEVTADGKLAMFTGRDESYPDELNSLIHPLACDLCNIKLNSSTSAKDHYESKHHDKNISSWLFKNYTEKGINAPSVKRFVKQGPSGPGAYHCEVCDLKLTSITHANQHYAGRKHQLVVAQRAKPSGAGYYNSEGKWVRTGTKVSPKQYKDRRFGIGEKFKYAGLLGSTKGEKNPNEATTYAADTTTIEGEARAGDAKNNKMTGQDQDDSLFCAICKVCVTSAVQMTMHLSGSKHMKKLKLNETDLVSSQMDNVLLSAIKDEIKPDPSDLSIYRTPSGQYYCKTCNTSMSHLPGLEQHLKGKRHMKKQTEEKAMAVLTCKKQKNY